MRPVAVALLLLALPAAAATPSLQVSRRFGEQADAVSTAVQSDAAGNVYLCGVARGPGFPLVWPLQTTGAIFLTKLDPSGTILYSTLLGAGYTDTLGGCAVDRAGNAWIAGSTDSPNFPTTPGALQPKLAGQRDAFVMKIDPTGQRLLYSTCLGGILDDLALAVAVDSAGSPYIAGYAVAGFPVTPGGSLGTPGAPSVFVTKLSPDGAFLRYSSMLDASSFYTIGLCVTDLAEAAVLVTDGQGSRVVKLNAAGDRIVYRAFAPAGVQLLAVASDAQGFVWAVGGTSAPGAATAAAAQARPGGNAYYRSADSGATWAADGDLDADSVYQLAAHSGNLYAATASGLFRSADAGLHWSRLLADATLRIVFHPATPGIFYVTRRTGDSILKTSDDGRSWQEIGPRQPDGPLLTALAIDPRPPFTLYAAGRRVYRSADDGATWNASATLPGLGAMALAVDASDSSVVYASTSQTYAGGGAAPAIPTSPGLLRSTDGGASFEPFSGPISVVSLAADPTRPGTAYAAGSRLYKTADFGADWTALNSYPEQPRVFAMDGGRLYVLGTGGLAYSDDGGATFTSNAAFPISAAQAFAIDGGTMHLGGQRSANAFAMMLDDSGDIAYATYWGGRVQESATSVAIGSDGSVYVGGWGWSPDFPERDALREYSGGADGFLLKLDSAGGVVYSTSWGGSRDERVYSVAAAPGGRVWFTGATNSSDFPASPGGSVFLVGFR